MTEYLISMFIDNELDLDEKIQFLEIIHSDSAYKAETVDLICQEKELRQRPVGTVPPLVAEPFRQQRRFQWLRPVLIGLGCAAVIAFLWVNLVPFNPADVKQASKFHRFIIYQPDISSAEITGSFTGWQSQKMNPIGTSGYWEKEIELSSGEHRFAYILNHHRRIPDPTVPIREKDDFGGENSILSISL
ncbi:MAG: glycogen-binding domain-containing protein [Desulfobacteraceae bacterium]|jgi:hypothetical protein